MGEVWTSASVVATPADMEGLGRRIGALLRAGDLVMLSGPLGAGKTTLTRGIAEVLGVRGPITSPTFVLARTHPNLGDGPALTHVDAYRLGSALELDDLDIDMTGSVVVVEWGAGLVEDAVDSRLEVSIRRPTGGPDTGAEGDVESDEEPVEPREVTLAAFGPGWQDRGLPSSSAASPG